MRMFLLGSAAAIVTCLILTWLAVVGGWLPVNADALPAPAERWAARTAVIAGIERVATRGRNPRSGEAALLDGVGVYRRDCEVCHGDSHGTTSPIARGLYQRPPDFGRDGADDLPFSFASWVIRHGIRLTGMPSFSPALSETQIDDVALFLKRMNALTPPEKFAWGGSPLRASLAPLYRTIGGSRTCVYLPAPHVRAHHFQSETTVTDDGVFIIEHFYNRGISEVSVLGVDLARHRFVRTKLSKDGTADVAVAPLVPEASWAWRSVGDSEQSGTVTTISARPDGSYTFAATNDPGAGTCSANAW